MATLMQAGNNERFLEFGLGTEDFAIPLLQVREVIPVPETTPIPKAPPHFLGIMNLRGQVISIVDLRKKMQISRPKDQVTEEAVIIVDINGVNVGVIVDSIYRVLTFSYSEISKIPELESQVNAKFIQGVYQKESSLTLLLDMGLILDLKDKEILKKAS